MTTGRGKQILTFGVDFGEEEVFEPSANNYNSRAGPRTKGFASLSNEEVDKVSVKTKRTNFTAATFNGRGDHGIL